MKMLDDLYLTFTKILKDCMTICDGETYDIVRIGMILTCTVYLGLSIANYDDFNPEAFGAGIGFLFTGGSAGLLIKDKTEPKSRADNGN
jgi:hypothetical protein